VWNQRIAADRVMKLRIQVNDISGIDLAP